MGETLVMSHVVFRHGNKLFDTTLGYPNDPHANMDLYPFKKGELTLEGKRNSYKLGEDLRKLYSKFLGSTYYSGIVNATTADTERNEMTVQCVLSSLFPASPENQLKEGINWQPVLYKKLNIKDDALISMYVHTHIWQSKFGEINEDTRKVFNYLAKHMGTDVNNINAFFIYNTLKLQEEQNLPLPEWVKTIWPEPLKKLAMDWLSAFVNKYLKLYVENIVAKILADTRETIKSTKKHKTKLFMYSAHDMNVTTLLNLINFSDYMKEINYCACFIMEVHLINGVYGFKILHKNGNDEEFRYLPILDEGEFCALDKFEELAKAKYNS